MSIIRGGNRKQLRPDIRYIIFIVRGSVKSILKISLPEHHTMYTYSLRSVFFFYIFRIPVYGQHSGALLVFVNVFPSLPSFCKPRKEFVRLMADCYGPESGSVRVRNARLLKLATNKQYAVTSFLIFFLYIYTL